MEGLLENQEASNKNRPTFITVLAILSWIFVGLGLIGVLTTATKSAEEMDNEIANTIAQIEISPIAATPYFDDYVRFAEQSSGVTKTMNIFNLIVLLVEGLGVYMIFQLKKTGYWIYTASNLLFISLPFIFLPTSNLFTVMTAGLYIFIALLFQILYGVNLKHLKK